MNKIDELKEQFSKEIKELEEKHLKELSKLQEPTIGIKDWDSLKEIEGYYVSDYSSTFHLELDPVAKKHQNVFKTEKEAKASVAMAQLSQLMASEYYNDTPQEVWCDWTSPNQIKHCIYLWKEELLLAPMTLNKNFLAFESEITAEIFLKNHKDLIEQAKPLL